MTNWRRCYEAPARQGSLSDARRVEAGGKKPPAWGQRLVVAGLSS